MSESQDTTMLDLAFSLNGRRVAMTLPTNTTLADLLRERCGLTGTKIGCSRAVCGSCSVLLDGDPVAACAVFAFEVEGRAVTTIEGLGGVEGALDPVQQAFLENSAFQCGYCTSGMIILAKALLDRHPDPDRATIIEWMSSNVCRCTGYAMIVDAVTDAAGRRKRMDGQA